MLISADRFLHPASATHKPLVAVSACLTGSAVRYDGTDKRQPGLDCWLREQVMLLPICPEMEAGLGVPRPPVQLVQTAHGIRALGRDRAPGDENALDVTAALTTTARRQAATLSALPLCGYLWKSRSPSCGFGSTPLFDDSGRQRGVGSGVQAATIAATLPWLAMAEEESLQQEERAQRFLFCCRIVFDCLHAGAVTAAQIGVHYRELLGNAASEPLRAATARDDRHAMTALLVAAALQRPLPMPSANA